MARRLFAFAIWFVILWCAWAYPSFASAATVEAGDIVWTVIIPDAFPRDVYTWHVRSDGTYREDGPYHPVQVSGSAAAERRMGSQHAPSLAVVHPVDRRLTLRFFDIGSPEKFSVRLLKVAGVFPNRPLPFQRCRTPDRVRPIP